jgi:REP element-mobilizing transposase RayT
LEKIPEHYDNIQLDKFIVMPNHIHGIIIINSSGRTEQCSVPTKKIEHDNKNYGSISRIIKSYKTVVTKTIRNEFRIHEFGWQRSFYDHIIRNEESLNKIREYITDNRKYYDVAGNTYSR